MKTRHIFVLAALALTLSLLFVGQAASKPGPLSTAQIQNLSRTSAPDLIERYIDRQSTSGSATTVSSDGFDVRDALIGAAAGIGIAICAAGLFVAASRSRRPQVAL